MEEQLTAEITLDPTGVKGYIDSVLQQIGNNANLSTDERQQLGLCFFDVKEWMEKNGDKNLDRILLEVFNLGIKLSQIPLSEEEKMKEIKHFIQNLLKTQ